MAPGLALGAWAGFWKPTAATMMETPSRRDEPAGLAELAQRIGVMAIHNHVVGDPQIAYAFPCGR